MKDCPGAFANEDEKPKRISRGRKLAFPEMEEQLILWLEGELEKGQPVSRKTIRNKAKVLSNSREFKASKGWIEKFFRRHPEIYELYFLQLQPHQQQKDHSPLQQSLLKHNDSPKIFY